MKNSKGFTLVELMITIAIVAILSVITLGALSNTFLNNKGFTEDRAYEGLASYLETNKFPGISRKTCAGDGKDQDGYGSCSFAYLVETTDQNGMVISTTEKRIRLDCPTDFWDVNVWGATSCKEKFNDLMIGGQ